MKKLLLVALTLGAIYAVVTLGRRPRAAPGQPDLDQWEAEGGSVPVGEQRTAAIPH
jgi:hypothetical protein